MVKSNLTDVKKLRESYMEQKEALDRCLEMGTIEQPFYNTLVKELKKNTKDQYKGRNAYLLCHK